MNEFISLCYLSAIYWFSDNNLPVPLMYPSQVQLRVKIKERLVLTAIWFWFGGRSGAIQWNDAFSRTFIFQILSKVQQLLFSQSIFNKYNTMTFPMKYPSQRHDLRPTLKIITRNFPKFSVASKNFHTQNPKSSIPPQNFQNYRGVATEIRVATASLLINSKIFNFFPRISKTRDI